MPRFRKSGPEERSASRRFSREAAEAEAAEELRRAMGRMGVPPAEEPTAAFPPPEAAATPTEDDEVDVDEAAPAPPARGAAGEGAASAPLRRVRKTPREGAARSAPRASATGARSATAEARARKGRP